MFIYSVKREEQMAKLNCVVFVRIKNMIRQVMQVPSKHSNGLSLAVADSRDGIAIYELRTNRKKR